jgi:chromosome partitioning protein
MARVIAIAIPKGGTGKTTTALNLGAALAEMGQKVLLVDFDPTSHLTRALGFGGKKLQHTAYTALKKLVTQFDKNSLLPAIQTTSIPGVDAVPTTVSLNLANEELVVAQQREFVLKRLLAPVLDKYDTIIIDTLPYLGPLVLNALVAADEVLITVQPEDLGTESLYLIKQQVEAMRASDLNTHLKIVGILLTQIVPNTNLHRDGINFIEEEFGSDIRIFNARIKRSMQIAESQARHQSILQYAPKSDGATAYRQLAKEITGAKNG